MLLCKIHSLKVEHGFKVREGLLEMLTCLDPELRLIHVFTTNVLIVLLCFRHAQKLCIGLEEVPQVEVLETYTILILDACVASILLYPFVQLEGLLG